MDRPLIGIVLNGVAWVALLLGIVSVGAGLVVDPARTARDIDGWGLVYIGCAGIALSLSWFGFAKVINLLAEILDTTAHQGEGNKPQRRRPATSGSWITPTRSDGH